jgi:hypothetical protein
VNTFATIEDYKRYELVGYYSLQAEDSEISEAQNFFERMENIEEVSDQLERFVYWMKKIGNELGAKPELFRHEGICEALPPDTKFTHEKIELRLYCYLVSENVVILFNGDKKTPGAITSEDCPHVKYHHTRAKGWTRKLKNEIIQTNYNYITNKEDILIVY